MTLLSTENSLVDIIGVGAAVDRKGLIAVVLITFIFFHFSPHYAISRK